MMPFGKRLGKFISRPLRNLRIDLSESIGGAGEYE
jgi:hypothetical protein